MLLDFSLAIVYKSAAFC